MYTLISQHFLVNKHYSNGSTRGSIENLLDYILFVTDYFFYQQW